MCLIFKKLQEEKIEFRTLYTTVDKLQALPEISKRLMKSIEGDGHITNEASDKLFEFVIEFHLPNQKLERRWTAIPVEKMPSI